MEDISCTPNFWNSTTPSPESKSILRQLCRPDSHCISRFTAGINQGWPLKPARSRHSDLYEWRVVPSYRLLVQMSEKSAPRRYIGSSRYTRAILTAVEQ